MACQLDRLLIRLYERRASELRILASADFDATSLLTVVLSGDGRLLERLRQEDLVPLAVLTLVSGYIVPFTALGLVYGASLAVRHRAPARPWAWFWIFWAITALLVLLLARWG